MEKKQRNFEANAAWSAELELKPVARSDQDSRERLSPRRRRGVAFTPELVLRIIDRIRDL